MVAVNIPCMRIGRIETSVWLWAAAFLYAVVAGVTLQKLVLPLIPSLHAGHGLLQQDAVHYHTIAMELADRIRTNGWGEWKLFPDIGGGTGNVALLSALYAWFDPDPVLFVPFAAAAHATSAMTLYLVGQVLWPGRVGRVGGLVAATLFVIFPSSMLSFGQTYKDPFSVAGMLLVLYGFVCAVETFGTVQPKKLVFAMVAGIALIWVVRPYVLMVLAAGLTLGILVLLVRAWALGQLIENRHALVRGALCLILIGVASIVLPTGRNAESVMNIDTESMMNSERASLYQDWQWKPTPMLPTTIEDGLKKISVMRVHFAIHGHEAGAGSQIDMDRMPDSAWSAIVYFPRAAVVGLFSPFATTWMEKVSLFRVVGAMETACWYLLVPGLVLLVIVRPSPSLLAGVVVCGVIITFYSYVQPNVGTLFRVRGGPLFFLILSGAVGWARIGLAAVSFAERRHGDERQLNTVSNHRERPSSVVALSSSGAAVVMLTAVCYCGFLVRDLVLVNRYGLGGELDGFLSASMIPMFLVGVLMLPLADAMTAPFIRAWGGGNGWEAARLAGTAISLALVIVSCTVGGIVIVADRVIPYFVPSTSPEVIAEAAGMLRWCSVVLGLSAWTVVGNTVLNAVNRSWLASVAQLCVPVVSIAFILALSERFGLQAAIFGMIAGTVLTALLVGWFVRQAGVGLPIFPRGGWSCLASWYRSYAMLMLGAFLASSTIPMNLAFAARLEPGAVTAWALGGKLVQLLAGLATVVAAAILAPHLGRLIVLKRVSQLASHVSVVLMGGTWFSIVATLMLFAFCEPLVFALFRGPEIGELQVLSLVHLLRVGCLQIPFVVMLALITKLAAVSRQSVSVVRAVGGGVIVNLILDLWLVDSYGLVGIATATVGGAAFAAMYLLIAVRARSGLRWDEVVLLKASWGAMAVFAMGIAYHNGYLISGAIVGALLLGMAQWSSWTKRSAYSPNVASFL